MIELPEALVLSQQISGLLLEKKIKQVIAAQNPHKFAWFSGDPQSYDNLLKNKFVTGSASYGGQVEISVEDMTLVFSDGVNLHYHKKDEPHPKKHQLLVMFEDGTALSATISMYGGLLCTPKDKNDNQYYLLAKEKPSPLVSEFNEDYYLNLFSEKDEKLSLKAFLATNQRIPGLGNGVLQDILFNAGFHPKKKISSLGSDDRLKVYSSIKNTLSAMATKGGRDIEKDLYGNPGGYKTILSKNTLNDPCPRCGSDIVKQAYLGGSVYFCSGCQSL